MTAQETHAPEQHPTVWPAFRADDARRLIAFLVEAFGFEETAVVADGDVVAHAELRWPGGGGVMLGSRREDAGSAWHTASGATGTYVVVDSAEALDALHERAAAAGAEILFAPTEQDYGSREFAAKDPEGNLWSFGTYRGAPLKGV